MKLDCLDKTSLWSDSFCFDFIWNFHKRLTICKYYQYCFILFITIQPQTSYFPLGIIPSQKCRNWGRIRSNFINTCQLVIKLIDWVWNHRMWDNCSKSYQSLYCPFQATCHAWKNLLKKKHVYVFLSCFLNKWPEFNKKIHQLSRCNARNFILAVQGAKDVDTRNKMFFYSIYADPTNPEIPKSWNPGTSNVTFCSVRQQKLNSLHYSGSIGVFFIEFWSFVEEIWQKNVHMIF